MAHHVANINVRHRLTQIIILVVMILAGMLFSLFAQAHRGPRAPRFDKPKYRVSVHSNSLRVVKILYKKRMSGPKSSLMASNRRNRSKQQSQAETDEPSRLTVSNN